MRINYLLLSADERCGEQNAIWTCQACEKILADSGEWGWAAFKYDAASDTFTSAALADQPPQGNGASAGWRATRSRRQEITFHGLPAEVNGDDVRQAAHRAAGDRSV
jgi:hypothetical protein